MSFPLFLDEHVDVELSVLLRRDGFDVLTTQGAGRAAQAMSDESQLSFATDQGRAILTYDTDFFALAMAWAAAARHHHGIIVTQPRILVELHAGLMRLFELYPNGINDHCLWLPPLRQP